ncbi:MAG: GGDEF and EAL domain-containing protein [Alphaproteobacteria bacterium]|nr:GGDEF and EAL domain-containing protein [Alphaproteobacteria bacterium]
MTVDISEIFSFDQLAQDAASYGERSEAKIQSADMDAALAAAGEAAYKWTIASDELSWSDNASDVLGCAINRIRSGKLYANLLDVDNFTTRYETVMNSKTRDDGNGVPYHIEYMFRSEGRQGATTIWIEDQGRWIAGTDGAPKEAFGTVRRIDERHRRDQHLNFLGNCDPLTGMMNRGRMTEALGEAIAVAEREKTNCVFAIAAVNNLSVVNEAYGFDVADEVIVALGRRLRQVMRGGDGIARFSGGKFGIILNECDEAELKVALERFLSVVSDSVIETQHGPVWAMLSIGAICLPAHADNANTATAKAEEALHEATRNPSDSYVIFKPSERRREGRALNARCATEIVQCLKQDRFKLAFQPIIDAKTGVATMHEALLRMSDSASGELIAASHLVPIAENLGLVRLIDRTVMQMIVETLNVHPDAVLTMNVSGTTAMDPRWYNQLLEILAANESVAPRLTVEITETVALSNVPSTRHFVESLRLQGCGVAIDDFGAGFTSFRNLRDLPVNMIKLDGGFCQDLRHNNENEYIVRSLIDLAGKFKIQTVAEWIENQEDADILRQWGIDYLQGNLHGEASIVRPWQPRDQAIFSLDNPESLACKKPMADIQVEKIKVPAPAEIGTSQPAPTQSTATERIANKTIEQVFEPVAVSEMEVPLVHHDAETELQFVEIDASISVLRASLAELKAYFPDRTQPEQNAA